MSTNLDGTGQVERLRIASTGIVGIGTTAPAATALLDVASTTKGFLPPRMTTTQRDAISSPAAGLVIYNTTTNQLNLFNGAWKTLSASVPDVVWVVEQQAQGTDGGGSQTSWTTRTLNTELVDTGNNASVASNIVTLAAGTYNCHVEAPARSSGGQFVRLWNTTAGSQIARSTTFDSASVTQNATLDVIFTLASSAGVRVDHIVKNSQITTGWGAAANISGEVEQYTSLYCLKLQ